MDRELATKLIAIGLLVSLGATGLAEEVLPVHAELGHQGGNTGPRVQSIMAVTTTTSSVAPFVKLRPM